MFLDDYTALKPLIDYKELSELITLNESILDPEKVRPFRARYDRETPDSEKSQGLIPGKYVDRLDVP